MNARAIFLSAAVSVLSATAAAAQTVAVFKDAGCGCCGGWIAHMQQNGFSVDAANVEPERMQQVKSRAGISSDIASCHTAFVEGYFVEGHVPAEDVERLISQRPDAAGLAAPGMPLGSPGMEGSGAQRYQVLLVLKDGTTEVFAVH
ncbi:hypothetical protein MAXJ12_19208 [Mesorhizobium alhagi CCNWXJ12-2]|uniref:Metal-binding protein n=1 Tax=Mesorhizobium alhagi CCNWXJ12-2 TaxID=1107882 RepID=H0HUK0_9HYPH|nr:hypothetical protein MAXJ12_19208 [Mesorhizobium alhagi CCNWXJ12-2]